MLAWWMLSCLGCEGYESYDDCVVNEDYECYEGLRVMRVGKGCEGYEG